MPAYTHNLTENVTYWAPAGNDGFGRTDFDAPAALTGRWQNRSVLFRDTQGRERVSDAVVYLSADTVAGGFLLRGVSTDATPPAEAREIRQRFDSPALGGEETLYKAML